MTATDVPIQPAATVMLLRDTDIDAGEGIEVFMLRRTAKAAFAGGMYVFPGGRVDPADGEGDTAYVQAAIRECFEEAGVLLVRTIDGERISDGHPVFARRHAVHDGHVDFAALCRDHGLQPALDDLAWVARWITPKGESARRFDTRFFVAEVPPGQSSVHDDTETVASEWVRPRDALERAARRDLAMMPPTIASLEALAGHPNAAAALAWARTVGTPAAVLPKLRRDAAGRIRGIALPGDADYDELD